jgi:hypothetical protein
MYQFIILNKIEKLAAKGIENRISVNCCDVGGGVIFKCPKMTC